MRETTKHYIAYMDILGYKEYLQKHPDDAPKYLETILDAVEKVKQCAGAFTKTASDYFLVDGKIKLKIFSDNIFICLPVTEDPAEIRRVIAFIIQVASIQRGLVLQHGLIMRGGLTIGDVFINDDIVFGQGLIDAVNMESTAEFPCISVSDEFQKHLCCLLKDVTPQYEKYQQIVKKHRAKQALTPEEKRYLQKNGETVVREVYYHSTLQELIKCFDKEKAFLNYLFDLSLGNLLGYEFAAFAEDSARKEPEKYRGIVETLDDPRDILFAHREVMLKKVREICHYQGISVSDQKALDGREKVIRKYLWLVRYHQMLCEKYHFKQGLLAYHIDCDPVVLRVTIRIDE